MVILIWLLVFYIIYRNSDEIIKGKREAFILAAFLLIMVFFVFKFSGTNGISVAMCIMFFPFVTFVLAFLLGLILAPVLLLLKAFYSEHEERIDNFYILLIIMLICTIYLFIPIETVALLKEDGMGIREIWDPRH